MEDVKIIDLESMLDFKQEMLRDGHCGPSHSCGGGR
ncbi:Uncharacterised protein [Streptococcus gallolyticus]|uniref:Uncharacterized protein n=1 Tax=Streptococcus gallolyticus TaxID=315405 RepID=A0AA94SAL9_9STRE|nr:hypothetical protein BTR42_10345 [Streptococcus gallolyticus subsp. gallolyticus DSM 16831]SQG80340.1 Uncharacterised protein [Streptococcus gallolyticus]